MVVVGGGAGGGMDFLFVVIVLSCLHAEELLPFLRIIGMFSFVGSSESG